MRDAEPVQGSDDQVIALLSAACESLHQAAAVRGWACSAEDLRERVRLAQQVTAVAEGVRLGLLRQLQARPEAVAGASADKAAATFLVHGCRVNPWQAGRDVAAAEAADPEGRLLPLVGAALAAGEISRAHVDVCTSAVNRLPAAVKSVVLADGRTGMERIDEFLVDYCRAHSPATVKQVVHELVHLLRPDDDDLTSDAVARRRLRYRTDPDTGMLSGSFDLDPAAGVEVVAALEALAAPRPDGTARTPEGDCETVTDLRTRPQRVADALAAMAEIALATRTPHRPEAAGEEPTEEPSQEPSQEPGQEPSQEPGDQLSEEPGDVPTRAGQTVDGETPEQRGLRRRILPDINIITTWEQLVAAGLAPAVPGQGRSTASESDVAGERDPAGESRSDHCAPGLGVAAGLARTALSGGGDRHGALLSPGTLGRLACDGIWRRVLVSPSGTPLDVGRGQRLATRAQRMALTIRDGGCLIPGCGMPVSWCDIHHHTGWAAGGPTDLDNLYPLCGRHHTEVHAGIWTIHWRDGLPWVRPPVWYDRAQQLRRNATHQARDEARRQGRQLRIDLEAARPPSTWPPLVADAETAEAKTADAKTAEAKTAEAKTADDQWRAGGDARPPDHPDGGAAGRPRGSSGGCAARAAQAKRTHLWSPGRHRNDLPLPARS